ncbi:F-box protein SKIP23-like isoform X1 [Silene latifolia]|uniref:F-box protein SKIP23-like isoform X1 n=1 Tax=Silene latifolia TaxID=37657 RepID=UPI003D772731
MVCRNPPWSDLPQELLSTIANTLTSDPISIRTFRSICRSWRSSCPPLPHSSILSPFLPLSILSAPSALVPGSSCSFLSVTIIYVLHRPHQLSSDIEFSPLLSNTCILFVDEFTTGKLSIRKPFSSASYSTPINFPNINSIDFNVRELGRFHNLSYSSDSGYYGNQQSYKLNKPQFCLTSGVDKVVMFPNASAAITLREDGTLGMYRLNVGINEEISSRCESKHDGKGFRFDDIVEYKGRVLGIDRRGRVYQINYHSSEMTSFVAPIVGGGGRRKRLVESLGLLYLVVRSKEEFRKSDKKPKFKVYELNEERKKWREIASLGDRCFSFGPNFSFSASAQEFGTYMKNCILFVKNSFRTYSGYDDDYKDFPKLKNSELDIGVWHLDDTDHAIESYPHYSDLLWPPPSWIWNIDRLNRIGIVETAVDEMLLRVGGHIKTKFVIERPVDSLDTILQIRGQIRFMEAGRVALEVGTDVINLRIRVNAYSKEETEFMHGLRESMEILNKVDNLFQQSGGTSSHGTTKERLGSPHNFKTSPTCQDHLRLTMSKLCTRYACLFSIEEKVTEVEMYLKSLLGPLPTQ